MVALPLGLAVGCVVEEGAEPTAGDLMDRSADLEGESEGLECGCRSIAPSPQNWDECDPKDDGKVVKSSQLVVANCSEVEAPYCDAQFGCEFQESECICRAELEGSIFDGYYWEDDPHWECTVLDDGKLDLEPCAAE
ncbi:MAG: hypothetical protein AAF799_01100 [Myxococcota bacterium]